MGNICPCPKRRKDKQFAYDVHEETFEIEDNVHGVGENSPKNTTHDPDNNILTDELRTIHDKAGEDHQETLIQSTTHTLNLKSPEPKQDASESTDIPRIEEEKSEGQKLYQKPKEEPKKIEEEKPNLSAFILKPKAPRKKYNPDDYRFKDQSSTFKVKKVDSIKEQQFNIDNCNDCVYFIFDITANLYIDDSENCFIFVAPCESTIFVRNCKNITMVAATKQFRTYECHNCTFSLYCKSQPVIESSSQLTFSSFQCPFYYEQLYQQLSSKKFQIWNNHWSQIHNFTKKEGEQHFKLLEKNDFSHIDWKKGFQEAELQVSEQDNPIPLIMGDLPYEVKNEVLIIVDDDLQDETILNALKDTVILKGNQAVLPGEGKNPKKVVLIDALDCIPEKFQELGRVYTNPTEIQDKKTKWFISFGDIREK